MMFSLSSSLAIASSLITMGSFFGGSGLGAGAEGTKEKDFADKFSAGACAGAAYAG